MRRLDEFDWSLLEHLTAHRDALIKAGTGARITRAFDLFKREIAQALRDYCTYDDIEMALEEIQTDIEIWRIRNDPAYDPTLQDTSPGLER